MLGALPCFMVAAIVSHSGAHYIAAVFDLLGAVLAAGALFLLLRARQAR